MGTLSRNPANISFKNWFDWEVTSQQILDTGDEDKRKQRDKKNFLLIHFPLIVPDASDHDRI